MSVPDASNDSQRPGVFLAVERTSDGYIETDSSGNRTQYYRHAEPETFELERPSAYREVDLRTGVSAYYVTASARLPFRAIGTEKAMNIWSVKLRPDISPGTAVFRAKFSPTGHPHQMELEIGLRDGALKELFAECQSRGSAFRLDIHLKEPGFCGSMYGRVLRDTEYDPKHSDSKHANYHLLPHWREHVIAQRTEYLSSTLMDLITVEWSYDVRAAAIRPISQFEFEQSRESSKVIVERPIEISSGSIEKATAQLQSHIERISSLVATLRTPLYLVAGAAIVIALALAF